MREEGSKLIRRYVFFGVEEQKIESRKWWGGREYRGRRLKRSETEETKTTLPRENLKTPAAT